MYLAEKKNGLFVVFFKEEEHDFYFLKTIVFANTEIYVNIYIYIHISVHCQHSIYVNI